MVLSSSNTVGACVGGPHSCYERFDPDPTPRPGFLRWHSVPVVSHRPEGWLRDAVPGIRPRFTVVGDVLHYCQSMVTVAEVRALARTLPRSSEHLIRDRLKFRVGSIVYVAFSRDESTMGFAYPREDRDALIAGEPDLFFLPEPSDLRFNWVCCHLARLDSQYMTELVAEAWRMVVPKFLARQRLGS